MHDFRSVQAVGSVDRVVHFGVYLLGRIYQGIRGVAGAACVRLGRDVHREGPRRDTAYVAGMHACGNSRKDPHKHLFGEG